VARSAAGWSRPSSLSIYLLLTSLHQNGIAA
jgi:hypothetical protein